MQKFNLRLKRFEKTRRQLQERKEAAEWRNGAFIYEEEN